MCLVHLRININQYDAMDDEKQTDEWNEYVAISSIVNVDIKKFKTQKGCGIDNENKIDTHTHTHIEMKVKTKKKKLHRTKVAFDRLWVYLCGILQHCWTHFMHCCFVMHSKHTEEWTNESQWCLRVAVGKILSHRWTRPIDSHIHIHSADRIQTEIWIHTNTIAQWSNGSMQYWKCIKTI